MAPSSRSRRRNKEAEKERRKKKPEALSTPQCLEITYTDLRRAIVETKPLQDFLEWAKQEKVVIVTRAFYEYETSGKMPKAEEDVKMWCLWIESDCMIPDNTAEEFYEYRNAMYADDFSKEAYREALSQVIQREKAFRAHRRLMRECKDDTIKESSLKKVVNEEESSHKGDNSTFIQEYQQFSLFD